MEDNAKQPYHVVSFSGGKDSTAMVLRMVEEGMQIDDIIFCDTGVEFPQMYEHIAKVEQRIGKKIHILKSDEGFEYLFCEKPGIKRRVQPKFAKEHLNDSEKRGYGWAGPRSRWCTGKLKDEPRAHYMATLKDKDVIEYVGLAADEQERLTRKCNGVALHPLVEWGMTESDCLRYCKDHGFDWGGLYDHHKRASCWCCPLQSLESLRSLYTYYPALWAKFEELDQRSWSRFSLQKYKQSPFQLKTRFELEKEYTALGKSTQGSEFYKELDRRIALGDGKK